MKSEIIQNTTLYNCDCMELMKTFSDKQFDLAIVDPPYGIGWDGEKKEMASNNSKKWKNAKAKGYEKKEWDNEIPSSEYWFELKRVSKYQIIWGGNYFTDFLSPSGGWIVWEKGVPDDMTLSQAELAWTNKLNSVRLIKLLWAGFRKCEETNRFHPTQKPVKLYQWLLENYAEKGQLILDTHLGSGSIAVACNDMGFNLTACELDSDYFEAACQRIKREAQQQRLFA